MNKETVMGTARRKKARVLPSCVAIMNLVLRHWLVSNDLRVSFFVWADIDCRGAARS